MCSRLVSSSSGVSSSRTGTQAQIQVAKKRDRVKTRSRFLINFSKVRLVQSNRLIVSDSGAFCPRGFAQSSLMQLRAKARVALPKTATSTSLCAYFRPSMAFKIFGRATRTFTLSVNLSRKATLQSFSVYFRVFRGKKPYFFVFFRGFSGKNQPLSPKTSCMSYKPAALPSSHKAARMAPLAKVIRLLAL